MNWSKRFVNKEDRRIINSHISEMMRESNDSLIRRFNNVKSFNTKKKHLMLYMLAMDSVFRRRFLKSPLSMHFDTPHHMGGFGQSIIQIGDSWEFLPSDN